MDLTAYTGLDYDGPDALKRLTMAYIERVEAPFGYRDTVDDVVFHREAVTLCEATAEHLYTAYTPLEIRYKRGTRPALERIVEDTTDASMTAREKALALLGWVRDLPDMRPPAREKFGGGTEEEIIETRNGNCANQARLFAVLAQIAGIPSRIVLHYGTPGVDGKMLDGHGVNEVYVEGRWAYMDIRGKHFQWPTGRIASALDLLRFPELTQIQPPASRRMVRKGYSLVESMTFFTGRRVTRICNYFIWESGRYTYTRITPTPECRDRATRRQGEIMDECMAKMRAAGLLGG